MDVLRFTDIAHTEATFTRQANGDLLIGLAGDDSVTLSNWYGAAGLGIERMEFADGSALSSSQLLARRKHKTPAAANSDWLKANESMLRQAA